MINVRRSQPAPVCLEKEKKKTSGTYRCEGVLERLIEDFHNKCYLCEEKYISSMQIEHLKPHHNGANRDLIFDWNNLFLSCAHCNNTKGDKEGILDCTDDTLNLLDVLEYKIIDNFPKTVIHVDSHNRKADKTAKLLNEIYHGKTIHKKFESENLRKKVQNEIKEFNALIISYFEKKDKELVVQEIKNSLSFESPFTAFKVWIIKNNQNLLSVFKDYLP